MQYVLGVLALTSACLLPFVGGGCEPPAQRPLPFAPSAMATPTAPRRPLTADPQSEARQILLEGLADIDPRMRSNAVEVIATVREVRLMPKIQRMLQDPAVQVRFLAALAVGDLEYALAKGEVAALLNDPDPNVKMAAAYALMRLGQPEHFPIVGEAIASKDQTVRANAALLLGKSGYQEALRFLYWTLQQPDSTDRVLLQAVESIAMLGDQRIYPKLWTRLISAYADDRMVGIRAMGALGTEEAKNALITTLDDAVLEVRLAAAEQLGKLGDTHQSRQGPDRAGHWRDRHTDSGPTSARPAPGPLSDRPPGSRQGYPSLVHPIGRTNSRKRLQSHFDRGRRDEPEDRLQRR